MTTVSLCLPHPQRCRRKKPPVLFSVNGFVTVPVPRGNYERMSEEHHISDAVIHLKVLFATKSGFLVSYCLFLQVLPRNLVFFFVIWEELVEVRNIFTLGSLECCCCYHCL